MEPTRLSTARSAIAPLYLRPETEVLADLLPLARRDPEIAAGIDDLVERMIIDARKGGSTSLVEQFMQEYDLSSEEGIALLSLAEAYLRVPDDVTATALIHDKITSANWESHLKASPSLVVNSATFGLVIAKALEADNAGPVKRLLSRVGEPVVRFAVGRVMQMMGSQFVLGRTIDEALKRADSDGVLCSFDMLGEASRTAQDARRYLDAYAQAIAATGRVGGNKPLMDRHSISVKLSALNPRYEEAHAERVVPALVEDILLLARAAKEQGIGLTIDAEEADRLEISLDVIAALAAHPDLAGWNGLGMVIQAYQKRASAVIEWVDALAAETGRKMPVRLVKGAYWDTEIKHAQEQGLAGYPVFTRKEATDTSYLACARRLLDAQHILPAFATHNSVTIATLLHLIGTRPDVEFQRLHGMGDRSAERQLRERGFNIRVYAPVGGYRDLLAYLVRRLLENGANSSFVHQFNDPDKTVADLAADPVAMVEESGCAPHPLIPLPPNIYKPERQNSRGMPLDDRATIKGLLDSMQITWNAPAHAAPIIAGEDVEGAGRPVIDPANPANIVGSVVEATSEDVARAVSIARTAAVNWSERPVEERAQCLERVADLLERDSDKLMALAVREAGKTIPDALAEVREAVDFCRYYANEARRHFVVHALPGPTGERNELVLAGRGVFACISPWNFPLAIFMGQITAALAAGNAVVAKPAPQTPLIAYAAIRLLIEAGIPADVIHLVPGGADVGRALVGNPVVMGVAFTGSTAGARQIARSLLEDESRPLVPLIAETGGLNAMIVDSTALPEHLVNDVVASAFQSAGQRCSALRLLCLQEDVADDMIHMLKGAMDELVIGDPAKMETDVGPLIDADAHARISSYVEANKNKVIHSVSAEGAGTGHFLAPTLIRLDQPEDLTTEIFGPVLHVVTWKAGELKGLVDRINAGGYGLTMGLHSRLDSAANAVRERAKVGNLYINRSTIGAVVGVQPFGGEGLSGTGPKAGGPHYLLRFVIERAVSIDTTASGGNASLVNLRIPESAT